jgi:hypothetical protein
VILHARSASPNIPKAHETIKALGEEAINEQVQWLMLRRSRPIDVTIH